MSSPRTKGEASVKVLPTEGDSLNVESGHLPHYLSLSTTEDDHTSNQGNKQDNALRVSSPPLWLERLCGVALATEILYATEVGGPVALATISEHIVSFATIVFVGRLGQDELAGASLALIFCNITGYSVIWGMQSAVDTLGANAFGAQNYKRVGRVVQRGLVVTLLLNIPIAISWMYADKFFTLFGLSPKVVELCQRYLHVLVLCLPISTVHGIIEKYLACQSYTTPIMLSTLIEVLLIFPLNLLFRATVSDPFIAPAYAHVLVLLLVVIYLIFHIIFTGYHHRTWPAWSRSSFRGLYEFIRLGVPGAGSLIAEWAGIEVATIVAGMIGVAYLGSQTVIISLLYMHFFVPFGLIVSVNARVGALLGARLPTGAVQSINVHVVIAFLYEFLSLVVMYCFFSTISSAFTTDMEVLHVLSSMIPNFAVMFMFDGLQSTISGVIKACGQQAVGFYYSMIGYWLIALPLGSFLAFVPGSHIDFDKRITLPGTELQSIAVQGAVDASSLPSHFYFTSTTAPFTHAYLVDTSKNVTHTYPLAPGLGMYGQWLAFPLAPIFMFFAFYYYVKHADWVAISNEIADREEEEARAATKSAKRSWAAANSKGLSSMDNAKDEEDDEDEESESTVDEVDVERRNEEGHGGLLLSSENRLLSEHLLCSKTSMMPDMIT